MKIFVQTTFPAPYRAEVFERLRAHSYVFVAYESAIDTAHDRNDDWYARNLSPDSVVVRRPGGRSTYAAATRNLRAYDAVLIYEYSTPMAMRLMARCLRQGVPYVINVDGGFINQNPIKRAVKKFFVRRARACLAGSESAERYLEAFGAGPSSIYRHNFTNLSVDDLRPGIIQSEEKRFLREKLHLPLEGLIVVAVGQFIPRKGFDVLLEAWSELDTTATLVLLGGGPEASHYEAIINQRELRNVYIKGFANRRDLFDYYDASDCFALPTREDVWGLVVNEAMARALPVVTTNRCVAGVELIEEGVNGFTVDPDDSMALARAIAKILQAPELGRSMACANRMKISSYTLDNVARSHTETLELLLRRRP